MALDIFHKSQTVLKTIYLSDCIVMMYCKTHYYRAPFNFTHFALDDDNACITGADIRLK